MWPRRRAIPTGDLGPLRRIVLRTRLLTVVLAGLACTLLTAAFASARGLDQQKSGVVPPSPSAVVVLDLSLSITDSDYRIMRGAIERIIASRTPAGLVVFSDVPYELLPPRTPASELRPLLRLLTPTPDGKLPPNPWNANFTAGTLISAALQLAQRMLVNNHIKGGSILLASDLQTAPTDYDALGRTLNRLRSSSTTVKVIPLEAESDGVKLFQSILGPQAFVNGIKPSPGGVPKVTTVLRGRMPVGLLIAGILVFATLAAYERFAGRLALPSGGVGRNS
jgi:hypothetical protein